jgi:hypothetical protein
VQSGDECDTLYAFELSSLDEVDSFDLLHYDRGIGPRLPLAAREETPAFLFYLRSLDIKVSNHISVDRGLTLSSRPFEIPNGSS